MVLEEPRGWGRGKTDLTSVQEGLGAYETQRGETGKAQWPVLGPWVHLVHKRGWPQPLASLAEAKSVLWALNGEPTTWAHYSLSSQRQHCIALTSASHNSLGASKSLCWLSPYLQKERMNNYAFRQPCRKNISLPRIPKHIVCQNPPP